MKNVINLPTPLDMTEKVKLVLEKWKITSYNPGMIKRSPDENKKVSNFERYLLSGITSNKKLLAYKTEKYMDEDGDWDDQSYSIYLGFESDDINNLKMNFTFFLDIGSTYFMFKDENGKILYLRYSSDNDPIGIRETYNDSAK
ncbi:MAG: hypothetical protein ACXAC7_11640 [Candidatus Hodarchaeales archaeon]|jgi:hypothetical protein